MSTSWLTHSFKSIQNFGMGYFDHAVEDKLLNMTTDSPYQNNVRKDFWGRNAIVRSFFGWAIHSQWLIEYLENYIVFETMMK